MIKELFKEPPYPFTVSTGIKYLSEVPWIKENGGKLPKNCLFNKVVTGCGATTIALTDSDPTIIAMPTVEVIDNKYKQCSDKNALLGVHSNRSVDGGEWMQEEEYNDHYEFENDPNRYVPAYLNKCRSENKVPKFMVTYDSLEKLVKTLEKLGYSTKQFNLVVDEYHMLLTEHGYRREGVRYILENFRNFRYYTFMTATPVGGKVGHVNNGRFPLKELKNVRVVEAFWETPDFPGVVNYISRTGGDNYGSVKDYLHYWIQAYLNKDRFSGAYTYNNNLYIFVNNIRFIKDMIEKCNLYPNDCRIIYSHHNKKADLPEGFERGSTSEIKTDPKKINFLTSSSFEGTDIYDPNGITIVVSNVGGYTHTDINVKLPQIAGRIRDAITGGVIYHIFSVYQPKGRKDEEDFIAEQKQEIERELGILQHYKNKRIETLVEEINKDKHKRKYRYLFATNNNLDVEFDENAVISEHYQWWIKNSYRHCAIVKRETKNANFRSSVSCTLPPYVPSFTNDFIESVRSLHQIVTAKGENHAEYTILLERLRPRYPELDDMIKYVGLDKMERMKYRQDTIQRYLRTQIIEDNTNAKLMNTITLGFKIGDIIPSKEAKNKLVRIFNDLGISKKPTARTLGEYFNIEEKTHWKDGKAKKVVIIHSAKFSMKVA
ncbi:MAG: hypothetical protein WD555_02675 [Fulvivirga sp.]